MNLAAREVRLWVLGFVAWFVMLCVGEWVSGWHRSVDSYETPTHHTTTTIPRIGPPRSTPSWPPPSRSPAPWPPATPGRPPPRARCPGGAAASRRRSSLAVVCVVVVVGWWVLGVRVLRSSELAEIRARGGHFDTCVPSSSARAASCRWRRAPWRWGISPLRLSLLAARGSLYAPKSKRECKAECSQDTGASTFPSVKLSHVPRKGLPVPAASVAAAAAAAEPEGAAMARAGASSRSAMRRRDRKEEESPDCCWRRLGPRRRSGRAVCPDEARAGRSPACVCVYVCVGDGTMR